MNPLPGSEPRPKPASTIELTPIGTVFRSTSVAPSTCGAGWHETCVSNKLEKILRDRAKALEAGKGYVEGVLSAWFPVIECWWWRSKGESMMLFVEGRRHPELEKEIFSKRLLQECGNGDAEARRKIRDTLETLLIASVR